jgi:putative DNA methylase
MATVVRKKLIEVALPLEAINVASAKEKSIRHGHPSTLHLWWARRPLAACRAVLFTQLVDDPSAWPEQFPTAEAQDRERQRLFGLIRELVIWENSNSEPVINAARLEIARSLARGRKSEGTADAQDEAVLQIPPSYGSDGQYSGLNRSDVATINLYLVEVAPPVHDPFAGGGSIPLEAQRLGLRAIATDLNPVAVLINKALVEIPSKFAGVAPVNPESWRKAGMRTWQGSQGLAEDVRYYGKWMREEAFRRNGHMYPQVALPAEHGGGRATVIAWLWARTVASPNPASSGVHIPLVSSFWLSKKPGKEAWVESNVDRAAGTWRFEVRTGRPPDPKAVDAGTKTGRGTFRCILSGDPIPPGYIQGEGTAGRMKARLMAIVTEGTRGRMYLAPTEDQEQAAEVPLPAWTPDFEFAKNSRHMTPWVYGLGTFAKLFTPRQLTALVTFSDLVGEARELVLADSSACGMAESDGLEGAGSGAKAYAEAVGVYLALAVDKAADRNTTLCSWETKMDRMRNTFGRQALSMVWDFAETNPYAGAGGDIKGTAESVCEVLDTLVPPGAHPGQVLQADARLAPAHLPAQRIFSSDPPYFDNVPYADLADFFYVWLRRATRSVLPTLFGTMLVPKEAELVADPLRHGGRAAAESFFMTGMTAALAEMARHSAPVPTAIYYAFKQSETDEAATTSTGWETFLEASVSAGFQVCGTWPFRTELGTRIRSMDSNALASSIVLVCRKRPDDAPVIDRATFRRLLRLELPAALRLLQHGNIAPVDLAQASIGSGMAIFSRHARILEADGKPMPVKTALQLINQALDEYLTEQEGEFDPDTRFAITWFETRQFETGAFGEAETLATARNVSVSGVAEAGIVYAAAGKVRLIKRDELAEDWDPTTDKRLTIWEATQHLIKRLETKGEAGAAELLAALGARAAPARDLAYRLYTTCERKGWAEEARAYNGLVVSWPELEKLAAQVGRSAKPQMDLL